MCRICGGQFIFGGQFKGRLTQRKTAELLNDQQWQAFQKSSNELGADGFQYDEAIGWTAGGEQKWA